MIRYAIEKHTVANVTKALAKNGGKHIYNILLSTDTDNGFFVAKGDAIELDLYKEAAATTFTGKVLPFKAANGNYYVEVIDPGDALFVCNPALIEEEYNRDFQKESNYFNAAGEIVRAYELAKGDILEISAEGFSGVLATGASVSGITGKKATIA